MAEPLISADRMKEAGEEAFGPGNGVPNRRGGGIWDFLEKITGQGVGWIKENVAEPLEQAMETRGQAEMPDAESLGIGGEPRGDMYEVSKGFNENSAQGVVDRTNYANTGTVDVPAEGSTALGSTGVDQAATGGAVNVMPGPQDHPFMASGQDWLSGISRQDQARLESILEARPEVADALMRRAENRDSIGVRRLLEELLEE